MKLGVLLLASTLAVPAFAAPVNVALGKPVTLNGVFGNDTAGTPLDFWLDPPPGPASLITDGIFSPDQQTWQIDAIWWHQYDTLPPRSIEIDLQGVFTIIGSIVQADNNDLYLFEYKDVADTWQPLGSVPASCCDGVATRPNRLDNTEIFPLAPFVAKAVRISGQGGDLYYSLTEVQLYADEVPEPSTMALGGLALGALVFFRRVRK